MKFPEILFTENHVKVFDSFEKWFTENYRSPFLSLDDEIEFYIEYRARKQQILHGLVADVFFTSNNATLENFISKIYLLRKQRSERLEKSLKNLPD